MTVPHAAIDAPRGHTDTLALVRRGRYLCRSGTTCQLNVRYSTMGDTLPNEADESAAMSTPAIPVLDYTSLKPYRPNKTIDPKRRFSVWVLMIASITCFVIFPFLRFETFVDPWKSTSTEYQGMEVLVDVNGPVFWAAAIWTLSACWIVTNSFVATRWCRCHKILLVILMSCVTGFFVILMPILWLLTLFCMFETHVGLGQIFWDVSIILMLIAIVRAWVVDEPAPNSSGRW